ncbi:hypothetical protein [Pseudoalteromonas sp. MTN2-4]|uniref:hypothetical protein n=1 Tax=Pseudoalteromonas sp. MTN2-4 TaxID=3056555 RepID=UPI0036F38E88
MSATGGWLGGYFTTVVFFFVVFEYFKYTKNRAEEEKYQILELIDDLNRNIDVFKSLRELFILAKVAKSIFDPGNTHKVLSCEEKITKLNSYKEEFVYIKEDLDYLREKVTHNKKQKILSLLAKIKYLNPHDKILAAQFLLNS